VRRETFEIARYLLGVDWVEVVSKANRLKGLKYGRLGNDLLSWTDRAKFRGPALMEHNLIAT
jgi:hypothetical protein